MKTAKIHKIGKESSERYAGFGQYEQVPAPLCDGAKGLWSGKSYIVSRRWASVTCKKCLKLQPSSVQKNDKRN